MTTTSKPKPYRRQFIREKTPPPLQLQDRDIAIIQTVQENRLATVPLLARFFPPDPTARQRKTDRVQETDAPYSNLHRRLAKLFHHGYLGRRHLAHPYNTGGSSPSIHVLDYKGRTWLAHNKAVAERHLRSITPENTHSPTAERELEHNLLGSNVHAIVEATCNTTPDLRLDFWHNESKEFYTRVIDDGLAHPVRPDAFSQISIMEKGRWRPYPILWEFDRSTMDHKLIRRKYRAYFLLWRDRLRPTGQLDQFENINRFRVATVTASSPRSQVGDSKTRLSNLIKDAHVADDHNIGSKLFLFTRLEDLSLNTPSDILNPIWHVGHKQTAGRQPFVEV